MVEQLPARIAAFHAWAAARNWPAVCDPALAFEAPPLAGLLAIWREHAGAAGIPERAALTARVLKAHLGTIAIIERASGPAPRYRVRLLGSRLAQITGEMQGKFLDDVLEPEVVPHWGARIDLTLAEQCPLRFVSRVDIHHMQHLRSESLWAPLAANGVTDRLVLMGANLTFNAFMPADYAAIAARNA